MVSKLRVDKNYCAVAGALTYVRVFSNTVPLTTLLVSPGCVNMRMKIKALSFILMSSIILILSCRHMAYLKEKQHKTFYAAFRTNPLDGKNIFPITWALILNQGSAAVRVWKAWRGLLDEGGMLKSMLNVRSPRGWTGSCTTFHVEDKPALSPR